MSLITIETKDSDFEINYANSPIELNGKYEIALTGTTLWYSWHNISEKFNNNKLKYFNGEKWESLTFQDGIYDSDELNNYLQEKFLCTDQCPILFDVNNATNRFILVLNNQQYKVDFSEGKLYELLGFEQKIYEGKINYAPKPGNITRDVDRILIHCSIVEKSYKNNKHSDVIYSFAPSVSPGEMINIEPFQPKYLPINRVDYIYSLRIKVTDQLDRIIDFNGENLTFEMYLRSIK